LYSNNSNHSIPSEEESEIAVKQEKNDDSSDTKIKIED